MADSYTDRRKKKEESQKIDGLTVLATCRSGTSLVTSPRAPPGEKRSGEPSRISWAYYPKAVRTDEIA